MKLSTVWYVIKKWFGFAKEVEQLITVEEARIRANGILATFSQMKDELGLLNTQLAQVVSKTSDEIEYLKRQFEAKLADLQKQQADAQAEIDANNKISLRLNEFIK